MSSTGLKKGWDICINSSFYTSNKVQGKKITAQRNKLDVSQVVAVADHEVFSRSMLPHYCCGWPCHISTNHLVLPCVRNRGTALDGGCSDPLVPWWETYWSHEKDNPLQIQAMASQSSQKCVHSYDTQLYRKMHKPVNANFAGFSPQHTTLRKMGFG